MNQFRASLRQLSNVLMSTNPAMLVSCGLGLLVLSAFTEFVAQNLVISAAGNIQEVWANGGRPSVFWPTLAAFVGKSFLYAGIIIAATGAVRIIADAIAARNRESASATRPSEPPYDLLR